MENKVANISADKLKEIKELEDRMGVVLVAYDKTDKEGDK